MRAMIETSARDRSACLLILLTGALCAFTVLPGRPFFVAELVVRTLLFAAFLVFAMTAANREEAGEAMPKRSANGSPERSLRSAPPARAPAAAPTPAPPPAAAALGA